MSASDGCLFPQNSPSVARWIRGDGTVEYLGTHASHPVTATIAATPSLETAFFGFRIPVRLRENGTKKTVIHVHIHPEHITNLTVFGQGEVQAPAPVINALLDKAHGSASECPGDIVGLVFRLQNPPTAIGPANMDSLSPRDKSSEGVLTALSSLVQSAELVLFVSRNGNSTDKIDEFCRQVRGSTLLLTRHHYSLTTLYRGSGGKDIQDLLAGFRVALDGPPSYDELAPTPPPPPRTRRRKRSSQGSPPPPKKQTGEYLPSTAEVQSLKKEMARLAAEIAELRNGNTAAARATASPQPEGLQSPDPHAAAAATAAAASEKLHCLQSEVSSLQGRMQKIERALEQAGFLVLTDGDAPVVVDRDQTLLDRFRGELDSIDVRIEDVELGMEDEIRHQLDEVLMNVKSEFQEKLKELVDEQVRELVDERLDESIDERLLHTSFVVERG